MSETENQPETPPAEGTGNESTQADAIAKANKEAARYRTERNTALKRAHAFRTILDAHNIDHSVATDQALAALDIEAGEVVTPFQYVAPKIKSPPKAPANSSEGAGDSGLTREKIEQMTPEEINKAWEDGTMQSFLKSTAKK